jgi:hypothetical protein
MKKTRRLVAFILINILVSAATTLAVLWSWERAHPSVTLPTSEGAIMLTLQPALESAQMIQITLPALDEATIEITSVVGTGDLEQEVVMLQRAGEGELMLDGWVLADEDGHNYTFERLSLYKGGAVQIYTRAGPSNSPIECFWGQDEPVWRTGETVSVLDPFGNLRASYVIP